MSTITIPLSALESAIDYLIGLREMDDAWCDDPLRLLDLDQLIERLRSSLHTEQRSVATCQWCGKAIGYSEGNCFGLCLVKYVTPSTEI